MKNRAIALLITAQILSPVVAFAGDGYVGGKLSSKYGPRGFGTDINAVANSSSADENPARFQDQISGKEEKALQKLGEKKQTKAKAKKKNQETTSTEQIGQSGLPVIIYGDNVVYHPDSGDFTATGKVRIYQGTQKRYTTLAEGNMKTGDLYLNKGGRMVDGTSTTDSKWAHYNFNSKTGLLKDMKGHGVDDFYEAPVAEIYPDRMELSQGAMTTRCPAVKHSHCLEVRSDKVVMYPNDKIIAFGVKVYVKGKHIYSRDRWINDLNDNQQENSLIPHIGYSKSHGVEITYNWKFPFGDKDMVKADLKYYSKIGWRPMYSARHDEKNYYVSLQNGYDEDDNDDWIKKERDITIGYKSHKFNKKWPLNYSAYYSHGLWSNNGTRSWHTEYGVFMNHDTIKLTQGKRPLTLDLGICHKWTKESITDYIDKTMLYSGTLRQKFVGGWDTWLGYYWQKTTNSVFDYANPDMARELQVGVVMTFDQNNNISWLARYDEGKRSVYEYVWRYTHSFCCWRVVLEYRDKRYKGEKDYTIYYDLFRW